jgi:hypothetical protein
MPKLKEAQAYLYVLPLLAQLLKHTLQPG